MSAEILNADAAVSAGVFTVEVTQASPSVTAEVTCTSDGVAVEGSAGTPEAVTVEFGGGFVMKDVTDEPEEVLVHFMPYIPSDRKISRETAATKELNPYLFHVWGEVSSLDITLPAVSDGTADTEYMFEFRSGTTPATLHIEGVKWMRDTELNDDGDPELEADTVYEVSIKRGRALIAGFDCDE